MTAPRRDNALREQGEVGKNSSIESHSSKFSAGILLWRTSYMLEESRQHHAALGHFWREAGFCILLALMKIARLA